MRKSAFSSLDLDTLALLCRIYDLGSLTLAAEQSGIAQSTASHTLNRLRQAFGDPLFQRTGRGVLPTERCTAVVARLRPLLDEVETIAEPEGFDAATDRSEFTIAGNFYEQAVMLPRLMQLLERSAPNVRVEFIPALNTSFRMLAEAQCDFALGPFPPAMPPGHKIRSEVLLTERYACFVDAASLQPEEDARALFSRRDHVRHLYAEGWKPFWHEAAAEAGLRWRNRTSVPTYGGVDRLLKGSAMVLIAPSGLSEVFLPDITARPTPFDCWFDIHMMWSPRTDRSPRHDWMRGQIRQAVRAMSGPL